MKTRFLILFFAFLLALPVACTADKTADKTPPAVAVTQPAINGDVDESKIYEKDFEGARKLQAAIRGNDKNAVARLIKYPIARERPLPAIKSERELMENWDDFFDAATISSIIDKDPEVMGWRGVMLGNGEVWFNEGKIDGINMRTAAFEKKFAEARKKESATLHPSAQGYKSIELECNTPDLHVRIQKHDDGLYYFSWKGGASLSEKPDLALKGDVDIQGSAGNMLYTFKNNLYSYEVSDSNTCEGACRIHVTVFQNGKQTSDEICQ